MSSLWILAVFAGCIALGWLWMLRVGGRRERASRPPGLRDATLVYMEHAFRTDKPFRLVARVDRAYRVANGDLVLVELKTRWHARPRGTDVVQLSAQRLAIEMATGQRVAPYAFVTVEKPDRQIGRIHHRVNLLNRVATEALAHRRHAILAGRVPANFAASRQTCATCAFRSACEQGR